MPSRPLLLFGSGGLAREVLAAVRLLPDEWTPIGAFDDDSSRHRADLDGIPVFGGPERLDQHPDAAVVLCAATARQPDRRLRLAERLDLPVDRWATVIHPGASVPDAAAVGAGTVLLAGVVLTTPLTLGQHVVAMPHVLMTHDDEIADGVTLAGHTALGGGVRVGPGAYLGQGVTAREEVSIGSRAVVGMGSVVLRDVPEGQTWAGVPARRLDSDYFRDPH